MKTTTLALSLLSVVSCASAPRGGPKLDPSTALCPRPEGDARCLPVARAEKLLEDGELRVVNVAGAGSSTAGALTMWLEFPSAGLTLKAKWKESAHGGSALNNEPRKELAAYALQKLFLEPEEYVVPPTQARCIPLDYYQVQVRPARPTFSNTGCVLGVLAYWIDGLRELHGFDAARFADDVKYREAIANLNLLTYLLDHRDTRAANFLISKDKDEPRVFSIDNGLALSGLYNPRAAFMHEWEHIIVPKVPHAKIERLRRLTRADLDRLGTVAEFAVHGGQLDAIATTAAFDGDHGVREKDGVIQLGLTRAEIDGIASRLKALIERVDAGKLEAY